MTTEVNEAELAILGSILLTGGKILEDLDFNPGDYHQPAHEYVHRTMVEMRQAGTPIDVVTVSGRLSKAKTPVDIALLHKAVDVTASPASAEYYAQIATNAASLRRLATATDKITVLVNQGGDAEEIVEAARREVDLAQSPSRSQPVQFVADTLEHTINRLDETVDSIPTGWNSIDQIIGGLKPGALYVIGARPSVGKSVAGLQLARSLSRHGSVAFVSLEMSVDDLNVRLMSAELRMDMNRLTSHQLRADDWQRISEWMGTERRHMPLAVTDRAEMSITDIKRFARNVNRRKPLAGIVVDYLQLMSQPRGDKRPRHEFVADMSRQLKLIAMDMHVPVIALSQLNRSSEGREDKRPRISDLRESGAVEQDADVVILMHREIMGDTSHDLEMLIAKNRHGRTGMAKLAFAGHFSEIRDN